MADNPFLLGRPDTPSFDDLVDSESFEALKSFCSYIGVAPRRRAGGHPVARLAPSVATRGELQLFNLDIPRFSVRVYLTGERGFINLRRMNEVIDRIKEEEWIKPKAPIKSYIEPGVPDAEYEYEQTRETVEALYRRRNRPENAIADCLLTPPPRVNASHFDYATVDLGWEYGEGKGIRGVPYMRPLSGFSGGTCAQACAFMCVAILNALIDPDGPWATLTSSRCTVHGLAEITALTTDPNKYPHIRLKGLRPNVLIRYFAKLGLATFRHHYGTDGAVARSEQTDGAAAASGECNLDPAPQDAAPLAMEVLGSYVRSGVPPILRTAMPEKPGAGLPDKPNHAVIVVGTPNRIEELFGDHKQKIVVNCPADRPFKEWDVRQFHSAAYRSPEFPITDICAVPPAVMLPLHDAVVYRPADLPKDSDVKRRVVTGVDAIGLIRIARAFRKLNLLPSTVGLNARQARPADFMLWRLRLTRLGNGKVVVGYPERALVGLSHDDEARRCWEESARLRALGDRWCWVQVCRDGTGQFVGFNLWDAEATPVDELDATRLATFARPGSTDPLRQMFLGSIEHTRGLWSDSWPPGIDRLSRANHSAPEEAREDGRPDIEEAGDDSTEPAAEVAASVQPNGPKLLRRIRQIGGLITGPFAKQRGSGRRATPRDPPADSIAGWPLRPSLITSFSATGLSNAMSAWPAGLRDGELYAFMHCDEELFADVAPLSPQGVRPSIASVLSDVMRRPDWLASLDLLADRIAEHAEKRDVKFGVVATYMPQLYSENARREFEAQLALRAISRVCGRLRQKGHTAGIVEISAGSLIRGLFPARKSVPDGDDDDDYRARAGEARGPLFAERRPIQAGIDRMHDALKRLVDACDNNRDPRCDFALELEPGPLFAFNGDPAQSVETLARRLQACPTLGSRVGLNIDIAHFILAGIEPRQIFDSDVIRRSICHFHVSDHGLGHFGDAALGHGGFGRRAASLNRRLRLLREWVGHAVDYAGDRSSSPSKFLNAPRFSGLISVELEAAASPAIVRQSCQTLHDLIIAERSRLGRRESVGR